MSHLPRHGEEMRALFQRAIDGSSARVEITEEEIALLADGRLSELAAEDRARVLRGVAGSSELQELVADARRMKAGESMVEGTRSRAFWAQTTRTVFALAACTMLVLGVWRMMDPPSVGGIGQSSTGLPGSGAGVDWHLFRDYALLLTGLIALLLSIPVAWWAIRGK